MQKILFVCHGNICRSPMAEFIFKKMVKDAGRENDFEADSAATSTEEIGNDVYPPAKACMRRHNIPFTRRAARQITDADLDNYDQIYLMDHNNLRWLKYAVSKPEKAAGKIKLLMSLAGEDRDVADPWYTGDFEQTFSDISKALPHILQGTQNF